MHYPSKIKSKDKRRKEKKILRIKTKERNEMKLKQMLQIENYVTIPLKL